MTDKEFKEVFNKLNEDIQKVIVKRTLQAMGVGFMIGILLGIML